MKKDIEPEIGLIEEIRQVHNKLAQYDKLKSDYDLLFYCLTVKPYELLTSRYRGDAFGFLRALEERKRIRTSEKNKIYDIVHIIYASLRNVLKAADAISALFLKHKPLIEKSLNLKILRATGNTLPQLLSDPDAFEKMRLNLDSLVREREPISEKSSHEDAFLHSWAKLEKHRILQADNFMKEFNTNIEIDLKAVSRRNPFDVNKFQCFLRNYPKEPLEDKQLWNITEVDLLQALLNKLRESQISDTDFLKEAAIFFRSARNKLTIHIQNIIPQTVIDRASWFVNPNYMQRTQALQEELTTLNQDLVSYAQSEAKINQTDPKQDEFRTKMALNKEQTIKKIAEIDNHMRNQLNGHRKQNYFLQQVKAYLERLLLKHEIPNPDQTLKMILEKSGRARLFPEAQKDETKENPTQKVVPQACLNVHLSVF